MLPCRAMSPIGRAWKRSAWRHRRLRQVACLGLVVLSGCAAPRARPPEAPPARPAPGYEARIDSLDAVDPAAVRDRRIAIDPGHGGRFRGSMGLNGFSEADANLAVSLRLRDLLEARGAAVLLTRDTDRDFLSPADSSLGGDLAERMRIANAFAPELFVSVHHNADAGGARDVNETQTYYRLGDDGPSLDAAESVHRFLVRNLGIASHRIIPGNYLVLRESNAPALLTESSYITNPDVEAKLVQPGKQQLEAEALYLGIAHYFSREAPVIESFTAHADERVPADTAFVDLAAPVLVAVVRGVFDDAALEIDGAPAPLERFGNRLLCRNAPLLQHGAHEATLRVRRTGRAAAVPARLRFHVRGSVDTVIARHWPGVEVRDSGPERQRLEFRDALGRPVRDTMQVDVSWDGGPSRAATVLDGVAWIPISGGEGRAPGALTVRTLAPHAATWRIPAGRPVPAADPLRTGQLHVRSRAAGDSSIVVRTPLVDAPGTTGPDPALTWLLRDGAFALPESVDAIPAIRGYRAVADTVQGADYVPVAGGALHGRRITLDPDGGGAESGGVGGSGTRAAHLNLRVARILATFLEAAGALVSLTRPGDIGVSDIERVQISEAFRADRYLRIGHRAQPPRLGHYYASGNGRAWAQRTADALEALGQSRPPVEEDAQYPLQQTSCPAMFASVARVDSPATEAALFAAHALRAEAYALYLGIVRDFAPDAVMPIDSLSVLDADGAPVAGAAVRIGGLLLESDERGIVRFARTEPEPIEVSVRDSRVIGRRMLLDSTRGAILTGPRAP